MFIIKFDVISTGNQTNKQVLSSVTVLKLYIKKFRLAGSNNPRNAQDWMHNKITRKQSALQHTTQMNELNRNLVTS